MDELILITASNKNASNIGLANIHENINASAPSENAETSVAEKRVGRKNLKTAKGKEKSKTTNAAKTRSKKDQKIENNSKLTVGETNACSENINDPNEKNRKRKSVAMEETVIQQETEMGVNAQNLDEQDENSTKKKGKRKYARKRKSEDSTGQKTEDDTNSVSKNTKTSKKIKNDSMKNPKKKYARKKKSQDSTEQGTDNDQNIDSGSTKNSEESKIDSMRSPKRKYTIKEKSQDSDEKKTNDHSNAVSGITESSREIRNDRVRNSSIKSHPPTSEMILESFRNLKKRNGTTAEEISKYIADNYNVNINRIKPHIRKFLQKGVVDGLFVQIRRRGADAKFKIRKAKKVKEFGKFRKTTHKVAKRTKKVKIVTKKNNKGTRNMKKVARKMKKVIRKVKNDKYAKRKKTKRYSRRYSAK